MGLNMEIVLKYVDIVLGASKLFYFFWGGDFFGVGKYPLLNGWVGVNFKLRLGGG